MARALDRQHFHWVADPRDADACLGVYFTISHFGTHPFGYREEFDPGSDPEFEITVAQTEEGERVDLTDDQRRAVEAVILDRFDFSAAAHEEREQADELFCLEGVL